MALSANTVWEVRTTGSDTNGGGFVAASGGTDYSQQNTAQVAVTDLVTNGTTTVTSATAGFTAAMVGNTVYITGGTGTITAARYQIVSFTNVTTVVLDSSTGLTAGTGATLNLGGAIATINELSSARGMIASNKAFVKGGVNYTTATQINFTISCTPTPTVNYTRIIGYTSTRGDGGKFTLQATVGGMTTGIILLTGNGILIRNAILDGNGQTNTQSLRIIGSWCSLVNVKSINASFSGLVVSTTTFVFLFGCEVTTTTGPVNGAGISVGLGSKIVNCWVHDNTVSGIDLQSAASDVTVTGCLITNNSGASSDGITGVANNAQIIGNTIYKSGANGINCSVNGAPPNQLILNNILSENGGYGLVGGITAGNPAESYWDGNAYYNNVSGTRHNADDVSGINSISPYVNVRDVILTADPFVNKAANDFRLNQNPGGGAACRSAGVPNLFPGLSSPNSQCFEDFGAVQHQDPGSAG